MDQETSPDDLESRIKRYRVYYGSWNWVTGRKGTSSSSSTSTVTVPATSSSSSSSNHKSSPPPSSTSNGRVIPHFTPPVITKTTNETTVLSPGSPGFVRSLWKGGNEGGRQDRDSEVVVPSKKKRLVTVVQDSDDESDDDDSDDGPLVKDTTIASSPHAQKSLAIQPKRGLLLDEGYDDSDDDFMPFIVTNKAQTTSTTTTTTPTPTTAHQDSSTLGASTTQDINDAVNADVVNSIAEMNVHDDDNDALVAAVDDATSAAIIHDDDDDDDDDDMPITKSRARSGPAILDSDDEDDDDDDEDIFHDAASSPSKLAQAPADNSSLDLPSTSESGTSSITRPPPPNSTSSSSSSPSSTSSSISQTNPTPSTPSVSSKTSNSTSLSSTDHYTTIRSPPPPPKLNSIFSTQDDTDGESEDDNEDRIAASGIVTMYGDELDVENIPENNCCITSPTNQHNKNNTPSSFKTPKKQPRSVQDDFQSLLSPSITDPGLSGKAFQAKRDFLLRSYFKEFNERVFKGILPKDMPLKWAPRLYKTAGVTYTKYEHGGIFSARIELSTKVIDREHRLRKTLMHEMCHAAAWINNHQRKPPHGPVWKAWGERAMSIYPDIPINTRHDYDIVYKFNWICTNCGQHYGRHSKSIDEAAVLCGKCRVGTLRRVITKKT